MSVSVVVCVPPVYFGDVALPLFREGGVEKGAAERGRQAGTRLAGVCKQADVEADKQVYKQAGVDQARR